MWKYNKAYAGGAGAAVALILAWVLESMGVSVPTEVEAAFTVVLSGVGPLVAPANQ